ncbi:MAG: patatin-like phospholipase family protein [Candidatus Xenobia bacterium]
MKRRTGLVLSSGGARGAYQAGVLKAIAEMSPSKELPFRVLCGVSAGSINCAFLAGRAHDFQNATQRMDDLWSRLKPEDVYLTDSLTLVSTGFNWIADLSVGGWIGSGRGRSLMNAVPMRNMLKRELDFDAINAHVRSGRLHGIAVTATNFDTGTAVTFFDGDGEIPMWTRSTRIGIRTRLELNHVLASAAIPIFFPAVPIEDGFYGDGCIRMNTPFSPAIHLGADRVLAIGVRYLRSIEAVTELNLLHRRHEARYPSLADIGGVLFNAMFLDSLETDEERVRAVNKALNGRAPGSNGHSMKQIPVMTVRPSQDLGQMVVEVLERFPYTVRHLFRGLGASDRSGWDLLSYLAFDAAYTRRLLDLGYQDGMRLKNELTEFLFSET